MVEIAPIQMLGPGPVIGLVVSGSDGPDDYQMINGHQDDKKQCPVPVLQILLSQINHPV
jgi:hypothetical protein